MSESIRRVKPIVEATVVSVVIVVSAMAVPAAIMYMAV